MTVPLDGSLELEHISTGGKKTLDVRETVSAQIRINKKTMQRLPSVASLWGRLNELYSAVSVKPEGEATALCVERAIKTPNGARWERD